MKGFIEVNIIDEDTKEETSISINVTKINYFKNREIRIDEVRCFCKETYEEIKQKIKEATEPRLMIDEKGNFKEVE